MSLSTKQWAKQNEKISKSICTKPFTFNIHLRFCAHVSGKENVGITFQFIEEGFLRRWHNNK